MATVRPDIHTNTSLSCGTQVGYHGIDCVDRDHGLSGGWGSSRVSDQVFSNLMTGFLGCKNSIIWASTWENWTTTWVNVHLDMWPQQRLRSAWACSQSYQCLLLSLDCQRSRVTWDGQHWSDCKGMQSDWSPLLRPKSKGTFLKLWLFGVFLGGFFSQNKVCQFMLVFP